MIYAEFYRFAREIFKIPSKNKENKLKNGGSHKNTITIELEYSLNLIQIQGA